MPITSCTLDYTIHAASDVGVTRADNEDAIAQNTTLGTAVLADGIGGHNACEIVSKLTVENMLKGIEECVKLLDGELNIDLARDQLKQLIAQQNSDMFYQAKHTGSRDNISVINLQRPHA